MRWVDAEVQIKLLKQEVAVKDARIAELEAALRNIADPHAFHTIGEMRAIAKSCL